MIRIVAAILTVWIWSFSSGHPVFAGEPVYRYALRHGAPASYEIYNLSAEPPSATTLLFHEKVHQAATAPNARLNLTFSYVNVAANPSLTGLPLAVRRCWLEKSEAALPAFLLLSPHGRELNAGALGLNDVKATIESPLGTKLVKQLSTNDGVALVLISSEKSSAQDQQLAEQLKQWIQEMGDEWTVESPEDFESSFKLGHPLKVGFVHFEKSPSSHDLCERSIVALLPSGSDEQEGPGVVIVFGRGRALSAKVGSALSHDQLLNDFATLLRPFDPAENHPMPGTDLLLRADWDKVEKSVRQRTARQQVAVTPATIDVTPKTMESEPATAPVQVKTYYRPAAVASEPARVSVVPPVASVAPLPTPSPVANFERVAVVGIMVAMLGLFMLTISIIRPQ